MEILLRILSFLYIDAFFFGGGGVITRVCFLKLSQNEEKNLVYWKRKKKSNHKI